MSICQENRVIYHYCSVSGFMNILQNQCLWLTEASFTNDAWENRMLDPIFEEALEQLVEEGEIACSQMDLARDLYYHHSACFIYLGCFSEEGDILPQWRSYADDGRGFAIGFNPREMGFDCSTVHLNADFANKYYLKKVIYMTESYGEQFLPLARNWIRMRLTRGKHLNDREIRRAIADDATFSSLRYYCKDASFATEKELRALWLASRPDEGRGGPYGRGQPESLQADPVPPRGQPAGAVYGDALQPQCHTGNRTGTQERHEGSPGYPQTVPGSQWV